MPPGRWKFWRQKSRRGTLSSSSRNKDESSGSNDDDGSAGVVDERISSLSTEETIIQIMRTQQKLKAAKQKAQDKGMQRQMQLDTMRSRKKKKEYDLKLKLSSTWNASAYLGLLKRAFHNETFPTNKAYIDQAIKVLKQEHTTYLYERTAKMLSNQNNEELMRIMGSIPDLKEEMSNREETIRRVIKQVETENRELKNVLHYKVYVMTKMKDKMEIGLATQLSLRRALSDLNSLDGSLDGGEDDEEDEIVIVKNGQHSNGSKLNQQKEEDYNDEQSTDNDEALLASARQALQQQKDKENERREAVVEEDLNEEEVFIPLKESLSRQSSLDSDDKSQKSLQRQKASLARQRRKNRTRQMNQPTRYSSDDENSLDDEVLDATPEGPPPSNPMLAAAKKAEIARRRLLERRMQQRGAEHLKHMNQPKQEHSDDDKSLERDELFEGAKEPPPRKPLLAAARKAREQQDLMQKAELARKRIEERQKQRQKQRFGHLKDINQPKQVMSDDDKSLEEGELFESPKEPLPEKPLLAAARRAQEQRERERRNANGVTEPFSHLQRLNQPKQPLSDDDGSLNDEDLFDAPKGPLPDKPLLAAAKKAQEQREREQRKANGATSEPFSHLQKLNQPKRPLSDDEGSLNDEDLFDAPKEPMPDKPLLAAAKKAQEQRERLQRKANGAREPFSHLQKLNQPKQPLSDDEGSLNDEDLFDAPKEPLPDKPLLAAAKKAQEQREREQRKANGATEPFSHLQKLNQPKQPLSDDEGSLHDEDLFDAPKGPLPDKPLLAAAKKAQEQREREQRKANGTTSEPFSHLQKLNQPKQPLSDDEGSLHDEDLFDAPKGPLPDKPLLAAAKKAQEQREREQRKANGATSEPFSHLQKLNQPKQPLSDDDGSLNDEDLFDAPKEPLPDKPLLAAAKKAQEQREREQRKANGSTEPFSHLQKLNQPKQPLSDDDGSLNDEEIFDAPKGPLPDKPLLAAAKKAQAQREQKKSEKKPEDIPMQNIRETTSSGSVRSVGSSRSDTRRRLEERRVNRGQKPGGTEAAVIATNHHGSDQKSMVGKSQRSTVAQSRDDDGLSRLGNSEQSTTRKPALKQHSGMIHQTEQQNGPDARQRFEERRKQRELATNSVASSSSSTVSERLEQQRLKAEAARKRLEERRKNRAKAKSRQGDSSSFNGSGRVSVGSTASSSRSVNSLSSDNGSSSRLGGGPSGSAIKRSRARRAGVGRSTSNDF